MSDESDKTVFKQPTPGGDRTSLRPMPGRRGQTEPGRPSPNRPVAPEANPYSANPAASGGRMGFEMAKFSTDVGLNPLVNAASTLIAVFEKTRVAARHPDVAGLHKRVVNEIRAFEQNSKDAGVKPEIILAARYLLCSALDEAVMHTPWGGESAWGQRTMLSIYHGETQGGEKCFLILDRMLKAPSENLHMLELFYICISLGFEGKYRLVHRGRDQLETLRDDLFRTIRTYRGEFERSLSGNWYGVGQGRRALAHYVPMWVLVSIFGLVLFLGFGGFSYWMRSESNPIVEQLDTISTGQALETTSKEDSPFSLDE